MRRAGTFAAAALLALTAGSTAAARDVVVVVDRSRSAGAAGVDPGGQLVRVALRLVAGSPGDRLVLLNAGEAVTMVPARRGGDWGALAETLLPAEQGSSDLLAALEQAAEVLRGREGICVLISDGELDVVGRGGALPDGLSERLGDAAQGSRVAINQAARALLAEGALPVLTTAPRRLVFIEQPLPAEARFASIADVLPEDGVTRIDGADPSAAATALLQALEPNLFLVHPQEGALHLSAGAGAQIRLLLAGREWAPPVEVVAVHDAGPWHLIDLASAPPGPLQVPPATAALAVIRLADGLQADAWFVEPDAGGPAVMVRADLAAAGAVLPLDVLPWPARLSVAVAGDVATSEPATHGPLRLTLPVAEAGGAIGASAVLAVVGDGETTVVSGTVAVRPRRPTAVEPTGPLVVGTAATFEVATPEALASATDLVLRLREAGGAEVAVPLAPGPNGQRGVVDGGLPAGSYRIDPRAGLEHGLRYGWADPLEVDAEGGLTVAPLEAPPTEQPAAPAARIVVTSAADQPWPGPAPIELAETDGISGVGTLSLRVRVEPKPAQAPAVEVVWPNAPPGAAAQVARAAAARADGEPLQLVVRSPTRAARSVQLQVSAGDVATPTTLTVALAAPLEPAPEDEGSGLGTILLGLLALGLLGGLGWAVTPLLSAQQLRQLGPGGTVASPEVAHYLKAYRKLGRAVTLPIATPPLVVRLTNEGVSARPRAGAAAIDPSGEVHPLEATARLTHGSVVLLDEQPWVYLIRDPNPDEEGIVWWRGGLGERQLRRLDANQRLTDTAHLLRDCCPPKGSPAIPLADPPLEISLVSGLATAQVHPSIEIEAGDGQRQLLRDGAWPLDHGDLLHVGAATWVYLAESPTDAELRQQWGDLDEVIILTEDE